MSGAADAVLDFLVGPAYYDSRTQDWPLVSGKAAVATVLLYLVGVQLARQAMTNRKPFDLRAFSMCHNAFMVLLSLWMTIETVRQHYWCDGWNKRLRFWGSMVQPGATFSPACGRLANVLYIHYLSKAYEFVDTFIMILKRNDRQVTFLHLYHHATTFLCWWTAITYMPGGDTWFCCAVNSFVHVNMYSYYLVAGSKLVRIPQIVKKSITVLQLTQFAALLSQALFGALFCPDFRPRICMVLALAQAVIFMALFGNFFRKSYSKPVAPQRKSVGTQTTGSARVDVTASAQAVQPEADRPGARRRTSQQAAH